MQGRVKTQRATQAKMKMTWCEGMGLPRERFADSAGVLRELAA